MKRTFAPATELARELGLLYGVEVQASDLVLVLVGHQLVQAARVGLGDRRLTRCAAPRLGGRDGHHVLGVAPRVTGALVADQVVHADLEQPPQLALGACRGDDLTRGLRGREGGLAAERAARRRARGERPTRGPRRTPPATSRRPRR